jgi:hypothetical protein
MPPALAVMSAAFGSLVSLAALVLKLHWQAVRDNRRLDMLATLITRMAPNGMIELDEARDDGSRVRLRISPQNALDQENDVQTDTR